MILRPIFQKTSVCYKSYSFQVRFVFLKIIETFDPAAATKQVLETQRGGRTQNYIRVSLKGFAEMAVLAPQGGSP